MNPFQDSFDNRLKEWKNLRLIIRGESLEQVCVHVDKWWQQCPLIKYHLHPNDINNYPDPWLILSDNIYCLLTRAIGICYTLLLSDITNVELYQVKNNELENHNLVVVGNAKYVLNYYPESVLSTNLNDFEILNKIDIESLRNKIK